MRKSAPVHLATLYSGRACHAIDRSNRIMLPADWRTDGAPAEFFVLVHPSADCLIVYPPEAFHALLEELRARTADKSGLERIELGLNDRVRRVRLDPYGRLPLPPEFLARVGLSKEGEMVGRFSKFEIWPCDRYQSFLSEREEAVTAALKNLESL